MDGISKTMLNQCHKYEEMSNIFAKLEKKGGIRQLSDLL
jgi:hypothetical protein